jgi:hypothetical protein
MGKIDIIILSLAAVVLLGALFFFAFKPVKPGASGSATSSANGCIGWYELGSEDELKTLNSDVAQWLGDKGFTLDVKESYKDIAGDPDWDIAGDLFCREHDANNKVFIFVPNRYDPNSFKQAIWYATSFEGASGDVRAHTNEFDSFITDFRTTFPEVRRSSSQ